MSTCPLNSSTNQLQIGGLFILQVLMKYRFMGKAPLPDLGDSGGRQAKILSTRHHVPGTVTGHSR